VAPRRESGREGDSRLYEKALKAEGVEWGETGGRITYDLHQVRGHYVLVTVERSPFSRMREGAWPSPSLVGKVSHDALAEFPGQLVIRQAGPQMGAENLILAMVAYLTQHPLPMSTMVVGTGEMHRLLNEYVLCEVPWKGRPPEKNYSDHSLAKQIMGNVKRIKQMEDRIPNRGPYGSSREQVSRKNLFLGASDLVS
jgi:hypothetical protein